jgi:hypothetical protein
MFYPFNVKSNKLMSVCQAKTSKEKYSQEKSCNVMQGKYLVLDISNLQDKCFFIIAPLWNVVRSCF